MVLVLMASVAMAQNPKRQTVWVKTVNDTVSVGLLGTKNLLIENKGLYNTDSVTVYSPLGAGTSFAEVDKLGKGLYAKLYLNTDKIILKSNRDSVQVVIYYNEFEHGKINEFPSRDTLVFRDTLTSSKVSVTYALGSQYLYITTAVTKADTFSVNPDSLKVSSLSSYGDTAQIGLRNLLTFTDQQIAVASSVTQKFMILDPICKYLMMKLTNAVLTGRKFIITTRAVRQ